MKKNEIIKSDKKSENLADQAKTKKTKKQKPVKKLSAKKLPALFKKAYTEKELEKKLLKKLYVESDKKLVNSLFSEKIQKGKKEKLRADLSLEYTKAEIKHFKEIAKSIKRNKGRVRIVPLAAVAGFAALIVAAAGIFKNPVAKKIIVASCEGVFGAKTSVSSVDVKLLGIAIDIKGLSIGNRNSDSGMKNLFDADIKLNVDLASALRGKFVSDVVSVTNIEFGRERTASEGSCLLPAKAKKIEKKASENSAFMKSVKSKSENAVSDVKSQIESILGGSNPDEIWKNLESQLKTKAAAEQLKSDSQSLVEKWKKKPDEIKNSAKNLSEKVKTFQSLNISKMTPVEAAEKVKEIQSALSEIDALSKTASSLKSDIEADKKALENATKNLNDAIASDKALAENVVDTVKNSGAILTSALDTIGYDMLGKYYPYLRQGIDYALKMKNNSSSDSKNGKKSKKSSSAVKGKTGRMAGTTFWYGSEKPAVWVKLVEASGENFKGNFKNISSNQDLIGKPLTGNAGFNAKGISHDAELMVDTRFGTQNSLITLGYSGSGFKANIDGAKIAAKSGIPSISGNTKLTLKGNADVDGFSASGEARLNPATLSSDGFGNEKIDKYYQQALGSVKNLALGYKVSFSEDAGVDLALSGNYTDAFSQALSSVAKSVGSDVKIEIQEKITEKTSGYSKDALSKVSEFTGISSDLNAEISRIDDMKKVLNSKLSELVEKQKETVKNKAAEKAAGATASALKKFGL